MGRRALGQGGTVRRHFTVTLDSNLADAIESWMRDNQFDNGPEAIRALCRMALAATPAEGMLDAMKVKAWNEVRRFSMSRVAAAHDEIADQIREQLRMSVEG